MSAQELMAMVLLALLAMTLVSSIVVFAYIVRLMFFRRTWKWNDGRDFVASAIVMADCYLCLWVAHHGRL